MSVLRTVGFLLLTLLFLAACDPIAREANINQDQYIDDYVTANFAANAVYREDGVCRVVITPGAASAPIVERGDSVYLYYAGFTFGQRGPETQFTLDSAMVRIGSNLIRGLEKGLPGAKLGEEALILFSADDGYGSSPVGLVPENTALLFDVIIADIKKNQ